MQLERASTELIQHFVSRKCKEANLAMKNLAEEIFFRVLSGRSGEGPAIRAQMREEARQILQGEKTATDLKVMWESFDTTARQIVALEDTAKLQNQELQTVGETFINHGSQLEVFRAASRGLADVITEIVRLGVKEHIHINAAFDAGSLPFNEES